MLLKYITKDSNWGCFEELHNIPYLSGEAGIMYPVPYHKHKLSYLTNQYSC